MNPASDICVIGNGIIGKVAALGLARAGMSVTLLTPPAAQVKKASAGWDVRVYALNQVAHALLSSLRVADKAIRFTSSSAEFALAGRSLR